MPRGEIDEAIYKRSGSRMMCELAQEGCFADARIAADRDGETDINRRQGCGQFFVSIQQAASRSRTQENRPGSETTVDRFAGPLFDDPAARLADVEEVMADSYLAAE